MTTLTRIFIDRSTRAQMGRIALPYLGQEDTAPLMLQLERMLTARFPKRSIKVIHIPNGPDLLIGRIRAAVEVDGALDQGVFFDRQPPDEVASAA